MRHKRGRRAGRAEHESRADLDQGVMHYHEISLSEAAARIFMA
jgi:hypothetical protein